MPDRAALQRGLDFEERAAEALGLRQTVSSGNQHHDRSDAKGRIRLSCKSTSKRSWAETRRQLAEAIDLAAGTGEVPALAIEDEDGTEIVIMRLEDAAEILTEEQKVVREVSRADRMRAAASTPAIFRDTNPW